MLSVVQKGKWFVYIVRWLEETKLCRRTGVFAGEQKTMWGGVKTER